MDLNELTQVYLNDENTRRITDSLGKDISFLCFKGIAGSAASLIFSAVYKQLGGTHLVILNDREEAAYFLNDLESLLSEEHKQDVIHFFPASYKKPYDPDHVDNANILLRAEVLGRLNSLKSSIIVTHAEALSEKVVTKQILTKNTLTINKGDKLSIDFILDVLIEYGFERVDYVVEPGQFSIRGGIVDIWSFSNENPYRIEFFGDEVDSIRTFDPVDQLSIANLNQAVVIPNVQDKLLYESRQSFLEYISSKTVIWSENIHTSAELLQKEYDKAAAAFEASNSVIDRLPPEELFIDGKTFRNFLKDFRRVSFSSEKNCEVIEYDFAPQPMFKKNFEMLTENLKQNTEAGITNLIFSESPKQIERLYAIFEDIGKSISFTPVKAGIHHGFIDRRHKIACYTDHQIFERYHRFRLKDSNFRKSEALTLKELKGLNPGDYVTHIDHGIGRFAGLEKVEINGKTQETIRIMYKDGDLLNISIHSLHRISKYTGKEGAPPRVDKLGSNAWNNLKQKTKKKVKEIAYDLIKLYAKRKAQNGFAFAPDTYLQNELEASFIYEDTPDQVKATHDVKRDMEKAYPMDRLVCGDVGFGKTEIAIRAAFKSATDGKQVAVLVPTTILALQHFKTFSERLKDLPVTVDYINRFKTTKEQKETLSKLAEGKIDILIGTHRIVGKDVKFKDLGLLIIDEEQKFGVAVKDKLKTLKTNVDTLTLTATPIPRTLQFSMMGARDLSIINTPPPNRYPVQTEIHIFDHEVIRDAVMHEIRRGGQVFFIHNRVSILPEIANLISKLCPGVKVATGHGQMDGDKLEEVMLSFIEGDTDVLVSTTIVESGLDISNANTIMINDAHMFGLSDLHQMRGRVGRSNKKAYCYLFTQPVTMLTDEARKRLKAIEEFSDLGSGFQIAMRDLDIRGAGNILGGEQSGFITEIGFEMYQKILDEAIEELKENEFKDLFDGSEDKFPGQKKARVKTFVKDTQIDTDLQILIPDKYVSSITERISLYKELDNSEVEEDLLKFESQLRDRFGPVPDETKELMETVRLRWKGMDLGFEKITLKNGKLIGHFISRQDSPYYQSEVFSKMLKFVQAKGTQVKIKETNGKLTLVFDYVTSVSEAITLLDNIISFNQ